jgi:hypothetical protein
MDLSLLALVLEALRRSGMTCRGSPANRDMKMDIGWPTDVRHVAHVTFDRFNGFLGLPAEFQREVPHRVPSARYVCMYVCMCVYMDLCVFSCFMREGKDEEENSS